MFKTHHVRERLKCLQILELEGSPTEDEIKKAYRKQALKYHPDKNKSHDATEKFQQIQAAYKFLTEGGSFLQTSLETDALLVKIIKTMFPWLFRQEDFTEYSQHYYEPDYAWFFNETEENFFSGFGYPTSSQQQSASFRPFNDPPPQCNGGNGNERVGDSSQRNSSQHSQPRSNSSQPR
ncbi:hypothetical protein EGW08_021471, partial [Elysia chlorotica]